VPSAGLGILERTEVSTNGSYLKPTSSSPEPSLRTDYAIPAPKFNVK
jgi:hypothetical protein